MKNKASRMKGSRPLLEALEEQVLYSADALGGLDAVVVNNKEDTVLEAGLLPIPGGSADAASTQNDAASVDTELHSRELVFIDADTDNYQQLVDDLTGNDDATRQFDVFVLDSERDGLEQISEILAGYDDLDAVHLISHGSDGSINLGNSRLDAGTLTVNSQAIAEWGNAFAETGDILIYGCNLAETEAGQSLINDISALTLADVAASTDLTGHASLGGDWQLELNVGNIETAVAVSEEAQQQWSAVLATIADDSLDYPVGNLEGNAGGSGWAGAWSSAAGGLDVVAGGLTHPTGGESTSSAAVEMNASMPFVPVQAVRDLPSTLGSVTETVWASFLLEPNHTGALSYMGITFGNVSGVGPDANRLFVGYKGTEFNMNNWGGVTDVNVGSVVSGETVFLVVRLDINAAGNDTATLYVNPVAGDPDPSGAVATSAAKSDFDLGTFSSISIGGGQALTANHSLIDSLRFGSSYADVAPAISNTAPVVATTGSTLAYTENDVATPVASGLTLSDAENDTITGATVTISANYENGDDVLAFTNQLGISGSWDAASGTLTLTGNASVADYQTALRSVTFINSRELPSTLTRTVSFQVDDGTDPSNIATRDISVDWINDAPVIISMPATLNATEQVALDLSGSISFTDYDAFTGSIDATVSVVSGTLDLTPGINTVTIIGSGTNSVTLSGNLTSVWNAIQGNGGATITYTQTSDIPPASDTLSLLVDDQGNTGSGGAKTASANTTINITAVNDAPVAVGDSYTVNEDTALDVDWFDTDWTARQILTFDNSGQAETLVDFPVLVTLDPTPVTGNIDYSKTQDNGEDLRFFAADGTALDYDIEEWNASGKSYVWVKVPQITAGSNTDSMTMYYGNAIASAGADPQAVWSNGYLGVQQFNGDLLDASGNNNDGFNSGSVTAAGQVADGQLFDGADDAISLGDDASLQNLFNGGATVSAWIYPESGGENSYGRIFDKSGATLPTNQGWALQVWGAKSSLLFQTGFSGGIGQWATATNSVNFNDWNHVTVSYDTSSSSNTPEIYINGVLQTLSSVITPSGTVGSDVGFDLTVGNHAAATTRTFDGVIDDVRISSETRSADWVRAQHLTTSNTFVSFGGEETAPAQGGLLGNDVDAENDALTVSLVSGPSNEAAFTLYKNGTFSYTPNPDFSGVDSFTYRGNDGINDSNTVTVTLNVIAQDDPAVITGNTSFSGNEGDALAGTLAATDVEGLTDGTVFCVTSAASNGTAVIDSASGAWTFTPSNANWYGTDSFTVTVTDDLGGATTQVVSVSLVNVDDTAVISGDTSFSGIANAPIAGVLVAADVDGLTTGSIFSVTTVPSKGTCTVDPVSGAWTYVPESNDWTGTDRFTVTVTDDLGGTTDQVVNITLASAENGPVIVGEVEELKVHEYEWLTKVVAVAAPETISTETLETRELPVEPASPDPSIEAQSFVTVDQGPEQGTRAEEVVERRAERVDLPPFDDLLALQQLLGSVDDTPKEQLDATSETKESSRDNLRRATEAMREQMSNSAIDEKHPERVADIALRVSGVSLSTGSLAWLLRGGSLFASALSSIPAWKGFDPLPVLAKKRKSAEEKKEVSKRRRVTADKEEADAGRILDSARKPMQSGSHPTEKSQT